MRNARVVLVLVTALAVASMWVSTAAGEAQHYRLQGASASAIWQDGATTTFLDAESNSIDGSVIFFDRFTPRFDRRGRFIGGTDLSGAVFSRRSLVTVGKLLSSAQVTATVPVSRCTYDASGDETGCVRAGSIAIALTFTGVGPTAHGGSNDHFHYPGVTITDHVVGTQRQAAVTGSIGGRRVIARHLEQAVIAHIKAGGVSICHGGC
jgi:hypothetical protein